MLRRSRDGDTYGDGQGAWEFVAIEDNTNSADTEYTDESVEPETQYVYRVKARNPAGLSERSSYANAETTEAPDPTPEPTPTPEPSPDPTPVAKQVNPQPKESTTTKDSQGELQFAEQQLMPSNVTLSSLTLNGTSVPGFSSAITAHPVGVDSTVAKVTVVATAHPSGALASYSTTDANANTQGHQVNLLSGVNTVTITAGPFSEGGVSLESREYTLILNRGSAAGYGGKQGAISTACCLQGTPTPGESGPMILTCG